MTTKQELHQAIDQMTDEQLKKVIRVVEVMTADLSRVKAADLTRFDAVLRLTEDPLVYQARLRSEWP